MSCRIKFKIATSSRGKKWGKLSRKIKLNVLRSLFQRQMSINVHLKIAKMTLRCGWDMADLEHIHPYYTSLIKTR